MTEHPDSPSASALRTCKMLLAGDPRNPPECQGGKLLQVISGKPRNCRIIEHQAGMLPRRDITCKGSGLEPSYRLQPWAGLLSCDIIPHHFCGGLLHTCRTYNHYAEMPITPLTCWTNSNSLPLHLAGSDHFPVSSLFEPTQLLRVGNAITFSLHRFKKHGWASDFACLL